MANKNKEFYHRNPAIAHVINPFNCEKNNPSYLFYAQPITFKSMQNARLEAKKENINVNLYGFRCI